MNSLAKKRLWFAPTILTITLALIGVFFFLFRLQSSPALASTGGMDMHPQAPNVTGDILSDTTWTKAESPIQVTGQLRVLPGVTLAVEPGVEVQFASSAILKVEGGLVALGEPAEPITFTGEVQTPGSWQGLLFMGDNDTPARGEFSYFSMDYAGWDCSSCAGMYLN